MHFVAVPYGSKWHFSDIAHVANPVAIGEKADIAQASVEERFWANRYLFDKQTTAGNKRA
jgi:hypothetical protein